MAQVTTLNLNGVSGPVRSFSAKEAVTLLPGDLGYRMTGRPEYAVGERPEYNAPAGD